MLKWSSYSAQMREITPKCLKNLKISCTQGGGYPSLKPSSCVYVRTTFHTLYKIHKFAQKCLQCKKRNLFKSPHSLRQPGCTQSLAAHFSTFSAYFKLFENPESFDLAMLSQCAMLFKLKFSFFINFALVYKSIDV